MEDDDSLERADVGAQLQPALRLYRRFYLARSDLEEAKATVDELLRARLPLPRNELPSPLLMALTTALVVAYARPFVHSRGQSTFADKSVPGSLLKVLTSKQREGHDYLIQLRNREMAHADADASEIYLKLHPDGHSAILRVARSPFRRADLRDIRRIISKLENELAIRCAELRELLPSGVWM